MMTLVQISVSQTRLGTALLQPFSNCITPAYAAKVGTGGDGGDVTLVWHVAVLEGMSESTWLERG